MNKEGVFTGRPVEHGCVFHVYLIKSELTNVHVYSSLHWTSNILQDTRKTLPCLNGYPVGEGGGGKQVLNIFLNISQVHRSIINISIMYL